MVTTVTVVRGMESALGFMPDRDLTELVFLSSICATTVLTSRPVQLVITTKQHAQRSVMTSQQEGIMLVESMGLHHASIMSALSDTSCRQSHSANNKSRTL